VKFGVRVQTWNWLSDTKLCKKSLKKIYPFGDNYTQNYQSLVTLAAVSPRFKTDNGKIWQEGVGLHAEFCKKNCLKGYISFGQNYTKKVTILAILAPVRPHF